MSTESDLSALISRWEKCREIGESISLAELCQDHPDLLPELEERINALESMEQWLFPEARSSGPVTLEESNDSENGSCQTTDLTDNTETPKKTTTVTSIPGYEILERLGRGGMGVVYKARHQQLDRVVALKMILSGEHADEQELERFRREARSLAQLQHPNIVQIYDVGIHEGKSYFSLEYCPNGSLDKKLAKTPMPPMDAAQMLEILARATFAAHSQQIIHRDLKPANVLLAADNTPKITDFGLAKQLNLAQGHVQTHSGAIMGTPSYMAPEQARGEVESIGPAADIYALGAILYECLVGRPPFKAATTMDTMLQVMNDEPVPPQRLQSTIPKDLETICLKCLQKDPRKRYDTALALAEDLRRVMNDEPIHARPIGKIEKTRRWLRRNPRVALLTGVLFIVIVGSVISLSVLYLDAVASRDLAENQQKAAEKALNLAKISENKAKVESIRASRKEQEAKDEAAKAKQITNYLVGMFEASDPLGMQGLSFLRPTGEDTNLSARDVLDQGVKKIAELDDQPVVQAALKDTIGNVYRSLGMYDKATKLIEEAYEFRKKNSKGPTADLANSLVHLGWLYHNYGRYAQAESAYLEALEMQKAVLPEDAPEISATLFNLAWLYAMIGDYPKAITTFEKVVDRRVRQHAEQDHRDIMVAKLGLAAVHLEQGNFLKATPIIQQALAKMDDQDGIRKAVILFQSGVLNQNILRNLPAAEKDLRQCVKLCETLLPKNHPYLGVACYQLGSVLQDQRKLPEAEAYFQRVMDIIRNSVGFQHPHVVLAIHNYCELLDDLKRDKESDELFQEYVDAQKSFFGPKHPIVADALTLYAQRLSSHGKGKQSEAVLEDAMQIYLQSKEKYMPRYYAMCLNDLAFAKLKQQEYALAETYFNEILPKTLQQYGKVHHNYATVLNNLALAKIKQDKLEGVESLLQQALSIYKQLPESQRRNIGDTYNNLREFYCKTKNFEMALQVLLEGRDQQKTNQVALYENGCELAELSTQSARVANGDSNKSFRFRCESEAMNSLQMALRNGFRVGQALLMDPRLQHIEQRKELEALATEMSPKDWNRLKIMRGAITKHSSRDKKLDQHYAEIYRLYLTSDQSYLIDLLSPDFDTMMRLESLDGKINYEDDDGNFALNSRLNVRPRQSGWFRLTVTSYRPNATGRYALGIYYWPLKYPSVKGK